MVSDKLDEKAIFNVARKIDSPDARMEYLHQVCGADQSLFERVDTLLRAYEMQASFLESPPVGSAPPTIDLPITESPGTVIGPYKLLQQIGEGGMGVVFMAEQAEPIQRTVALKVIKPGMDTRQVIARFEAERQAVAMMDHPNIAKVLDAGTTDSGRPYFVMELVKGVPITKYCDEKHLRLRERLELFVQVCQAVQHAHQKGIIHRDIKPNNVLVAEFDNRAVPQVIDFGVAKAMAQRLTERTMFTEFGQVLGTMEYMSPEQSKFNQLDIDTRSDIYSLGVLLYELLAGSTPFEGKRLHAAAFDEMLRIIREEEPPKPSTRLSSIDTLPSVAVNRHTEPARLSKDVRGDLDWIAMKALEKDRNRRYQTANGFAADVQRYLHDEAVQACPPSAAYRFRKFAKRNKAGLLTSALLVLMLLLGTVISTWQALRAHRAEGIAQTRLAAETEARGHAVTEAAKAKAISDFLQAMLASANPDETKGSQYTVRELLDHFSDGLGNQLAGQPEVEAAVRGVIGKAYWRLGVPDRADVHLKAALDLRRRVLAPDDLQIADSLLDYSWALSGRGPAAEQCAREALAIYRKRNAEAPTMVPALWALNRILIFRGRDAEAADVGNEALAIAGNLETTPYPDIANILHELALIKSREGKHAEAEGLARKAVAMHRRLHGEHHPETGWGLRRLAEVLAEEKKYVEAEAANREALAIFRRYYGIEHAGVKGALSGLTEALEAQGKTEELEILKREQQEWTDIDFDRRTAIAGLVRKLEDTEHMYVDVEIAEKAAKVASYMPRAQRQAIAAAINKNALLAYDHHNQDFPGAQRRAELAVKVYRSLAGPDSSEADILGLAQSLCTCGGAQKHLGAFPESETTLREALQVVDTGLKRFPSSRSLQQSQATAHRFLGDALAGQKRKDEAIGHCRTAVATMKTLTDEQPGEGNNVAQFINARLSLADAFICAGDLDAGAAEYRAALAETKKAEAGFPGKGWIGECARHCLERMARGLPVLAREQPDLSQDAHRLFTEAATQFEKSRGTIAMMNGLEVGYRNAITLLVSEPEWAAELDLAERTFRGIIADFPYPKAPGHSWRLLAFALPHNSRNLPRIETALREAVGVFEGVVADSPDDSENWRFLADTELHLGRNCQERQQFKEAEAAFRRAVEIFDKQSGSPAEREASYSALASLLAKTERTAEAVEEFDRAIKLNPSSSQLWYGRGRLNTELRQWDKAAEDLTQASKLTTVAQQSDIWKYLAIVRLALHDEAGYRQTCATLVKELLPTNPQGDQACHLAWTCIVLPDAGVDPAQVVRFAEAAVAHNPKDPDYLVALGAAQYRAGHLEQAAKTLADSEAAGCHEQASPTPGIFIGIPIAYSRLFLAMTHQRLDHHDEAAAWLKKAVESIDDPANQPKRSDKRRPIRFLRLHAEAAALLGLPAPAEEAQEITAKITKPSTKESTSVESKKLDTPPVKP